MRRRLFAPAVVALAALGACRPAGRAPVPDHDVLTAEEIATTDAVTAYEAVRLLRPTFLRIRGEISLAGRRSGAVAASDPDSLEYYPAVFVNERMVGSARRLMDVLAASVAEIRYLDPSATNLRYGSGYGRGALIVKLK